MRQGETVQDGARHGREGEGRGGGIGERCRRDRNHGRERRRGGRVGAHTHGRGSYHAPPGGGEGRGGGGAQAGQEEDEADREGAQAERQTHEEPRRRQGPTREGGAGPVQGRDHLLRVPHRAAADIPGVPVGRAAQDIEIFLGHGEPRRAHEPFAPRRRGGQPHAQEPDRAAVRERDIQRGFELRVLAGIRAERRQDHRGGDAASRAAPEHELQGEAQVQADTLVPGPALLQEEDVQQRLRDNQRGHRSEGARSHAGRADRAGEDGEGQEGQEECGTGGDPRRERHVLRRRRSRSSRRGSQAGIPQPPENDRQRRRTIEGDARSGWVGVHPGLGRVHPGRGRRRRLAELLLQNGKEGGDVPPGSGRLHDRGR